MKTALKFNIDTKNKHVWKETHVPNHQFLYRDVSSLKFQGLYVVCSDWLVVFSVLFVFSTSSLLLTIIKLFGMTPDCIQIVIIWTFPCDMSRASQWDHQREGDQDLPMGHASAGHRRRIHGLFFRCLFFCWNFSIDMFILKYSLLEVLITREMCFAYSSRLIMQVPTRVVFLRFFVVGRHHKAKHSQETLTGPMRVTTLEVWKPFGTMTSIQEGTSWNRGVARSFRNFTW